MRHELKKAIIIWLLENANEFQRLNKCTEHFRPYIYGPDGNYLQYSDGEQVAQFIRDADDLIYPREIPAF